MAASERVRLALVDDYEVVVAGLAQMFARFPDRVDVIQLAPDAPVTDDVDIALYDTFAQGEADSTDLDVLLRNPHARRVAVYTWVFDDHLVETALDKGVCGYLSKTMSADELVEALERIHAGEIVVSEPPSPRTTPVGTSTDGQDWPGSYVGLSERESEIIALITQGKSNAEIATLTFLSINSIKTYIRSAYAKMGVTSRTQAVLWAIEHGFEHGGRRVDLWGAVAGTDEPGSSVNR
jgi:DNA-binding NarL/FixJ family response regulator